jgi:hypothetical protein
LERLFKDQLERENVGLKAFMLAYDNISYIRINKGALAGYTGVEMLLRTLRRDLGAKLVIKLELDPSDPSTFKYEKLQKHVLVEWMTADTLAILNSEAARTAPGVSPYSIPAGVPLPQMPVAVNLAAIPSEETLAPVQATEEIPIAKANSTIDTKMYITIKTFETWTFQMSLDTQAKVDG